MSFGDEMLIALQLALVVACFRTTSAQDNLNLALDGAFANNLKDSATLLRRIESYAINIIQRAPLSTLTGVSTGNDDFPISRSPYGGSGGGGLEDSNPSLVRLNDAIRAYNGYFSSTLRATATSFINEVFPALIGTIDAILACSSSFNASYNRLIGYADMIGNDQQARANLVSQLESLKTEITNRRNATSEAGQKLTTYFDSMTNHSSAMESEYRKLADTSKGTEGYIQYLNARITNARRERNDLQRRRDEAMRVKFGDFIPIFNFWVWGQRSSDDMSFSIDISSKESEIGRLNTELEKAYRQLDDAASMKSAVIEVTTLAKEAINETEAISRAWTALETDYASTIDALRTGNSTRANVVRLLLVVAQNRWVDVARHASEIKKQLLRKP